MLPVKKAKAHCGYEAKPVFQTCGNCGAFASDSVLPKWMAEKVNASEKDWDGREYTVENHGVEKNMRCTDHGFATKKMATCKLWRAVIGSSPAAKNG